MFEKCQSAQTADLFPPLCVDFPCRTHKVWRRQIALTGDCARRRVQRAAGARRFPVRRTGPDSAQSHWTAQKSDHHRDLPAAYSRKIPYTLLNNNACGMGDTLTKDQAAPRALCQKGPQNPRKIMDLIPENIKYLWRKEHSCMRYRGALSAVHSQFSSSA